MKRNVLLLGSVLLIILAIALVSLISKTGSSKTSGDVRARAGVTKTLELTGTVNSVDEEKGTLIVEGVYLSDKNRAGEPQNLGTWTITAPGTFNFASVFPGQEVVIGIDAATFLVESQTVTALTIVPVQ